MKTFLLAKNNSGFTILQVLVVLALTATFSLSMTNQYQSSKSIQKKADLVFTLDNLAKNIDAYVRHDPSWDETTNHASNNTFECLKDSSCVSTTNESFQLLDPAGHIVAYDTVKEPTRGFKIDGTPCNTFDANNGNAACPARVNLRWMPECPNGDCSDAIPKVLVTFEYNSPTERLAFKPENYNFQISRHAFVAPPTASKNGKKSLLCFAPQYHVDGTVEFSSNQKHSSYFPSSYKMEDIVTVDPFDKNIPGDEWGLSCNADNGFRVMSCVSYHLRLPADGHTSSSQYLKNNGCYTGATEVLNWKHTIPTMTASCCKIEEI
jgi:hypothetical protein